MNANSNSRVRYVANAILQHRFIKFGCVGCSGLLVNLTMLYVAQEIVFADIRPIERRFYLALLLAIALATFNNYLWNRYWTWADRRIKSIQGFFLQMGQYYLSCTLSIGFQFCTTVFLAKHIHYAIANIISIGFAAVMTYGINHIWTFAISKPQASTERLRY